MTDVSVFSQPFQSEDRRWLISEHGTQFTPGCTLDITQFTANTHYPNGFIPSGMAIGKITASGLYGPYLPRADETVVIAETGSPTGGSSAPIYGGITGTTAAPYNATATQLLAALNSIPALNGNVKVNSGTTFPFTIEFIGSLAGTNTGAITWAAGLTGGSTPVITSTPTDGGALGGSDGRQTNRGLLFSSVRVVRSNGSVLAKVGAALLVHGFVDPAFLPFPIDPLGQTDLPLIRFGA